MGLPHAYFAERFTSEPTILFRIFNYEHHKWSAQQDEWGVREHTDYGFLTVLLQDNSGGLQVRTRTGEWIDAPPVPDSFVVNLGDMLEVWTHGLYKSTPHRVRNKGSGDRLSFPLFMDPNWFSSLEPIQKHLLPISDAPELEEQSVNDGVYERWDHLGNAFLFIVNCMCFDLICWFITCILNGYLDLLRMAKSTYGDFLWSKVSKVFPKLAVLSSTGDAI